VVVRGGVVVARGERLIRFDARTGARGAEYEGVERWMADPSAAGGFVMVGDKRGMVAIVDGTTLQLQYQLRGGAPVVGPVTVTPEGWLLAAFDDRTIQCYQLAR